MKISFPFTAHTNFAMSTLSCSLRISRAFPFCNNIPVFVTLIYFPRSPILLTPSGFGHFYSYLCGMVLPFHMTGFPCVFKAYFTPCFIGVMFAIPIGFLARKTPLHSLADIISVYFRFIILQLCKPPKI